jgi:hypothetical protein
MYIRKSLFGSCMGDSYPAYLITSSVALDEVTFSPLSTALPLVLLISDSEIVN